MNSLSWMNIIAKHTKITFLLFVTTKKTIVEFERSSCEVQSKRAHDNKEHHSTDSQKT